MANKGIIAYLSKLDEKSLNELLAEVKKNKASTSAGKTVSTTKKTSVTKASAPVDSRVSRITVHCDSGRMVRHTFYRVVAITKSSVKLQKLLSKHKDGGTMWHMPVYPDVDDYSGEIITKRLGADGDVNMGKYVSHLNINHEYDPSREYADNYMD